MWVLIESQGGVCTNIERDKAVSVFQIDWDEINERNEEYTCELLAQIDSLLPDALEKRIRQSIADAWPGFFATGP